MSSIDVSNRNLKTLKVQDIPDIITGYFSCRNNKLSSLEFGPVKVGGDYFCSENLLTSLDFCATSVDGSVFCKFTSIENLKGIHKQFKNGYINRVLNLESNQLKSHILGVILIPDLNTLAINVKHVQNIINKHLETGREVLDCQEELIQNGFKEFAQL